MKIIFFGKIGEFSVILNNKKLQIYLKKLH